MHRLYSLINLRADRNLDGWITQEELHDLSLHLGVSSGKLTAHPILKNNPSMNKIQDHFNQLKIEIPLETQYVWTSYQGFPLDPQESCVIDFQDCFGLNQFSWLVLLLTEWNQ